MVGKEQLGALILRADASPRMGTGHVMRSLGLAQSWQDAGGKAVFVLAEHIAKIDARLEAEGMVVYPLEVRPGSAADAAATAAAARLHGAEWIVLDGYQFDGEYQRALKQHGCRVMVLDDFGHCEHYWANLVLNQDINADSQMYAAREPETRLLLGTQYVLVRREFSGLLRPVLNVSPTARHLLVTLGGADPWNYTTKVVHALADARFGATETVVAVGPGNPFLREVESAAAGHEDRIKVVAFPDNVPELMRNCDLAISAGGSTMWELAYFRVPTIVLVLADNQISTAGVLGRLGACRVLENAVSLAEERLRDEILAVLEDAAARRSLAETFGSLIDGQGAARVRAAILTAQPQHRESQRTGDDGVVASL